MYLQSSKLWWQNLLDKVELQQLWSRELQQRQQLLYLCCGLQSIIYSRYKQYPLSTELKIEKKYCAMWDDWIWDPWDRGSIPSVFGRNLYLLSSHLTKYRDISLYGQPIWEDNSTPISKQRWLTEIACSSPTSGVLIDRMREDNAW